MPAGSSCRSLSSFTCLPHRGSTLHLLLSRPCSRVATEPCGLLLATDSPKLRVATAQEEAGTNSRPSRSSSRGSPHKRQLFTSASLCLLTEIAAEPNIGRLVHGVSLS